MALEIMKDNVQIIQSLSDYPNQEEGLTAQEMKEKFDEASVKLQNYINNSVVPAVNDKLSASEMSGAVANAVEQALGSITPAKIGAAPADHVTDKSNPHGVTAAQVGAAPAGFGLEVTSKPPNNSLDELYTNGWYQCARGYTGAPTGHSTLEYGTVFVVNRFGQNTTQFYVTQPDDIIGSPLMLVRNYSVSKGTWNPWECINPPMAFGVEYRTTERYNGKPVYVKTVRHTLTADTGSTSSVTTLAINGNVSNVDSIVDVSGVYVGTDSKKYPIPSMGGSGNVFLGYNAVSNGNLYLVLIINKDVFKAGQYFNVTFKYTKTTD